MGKVIGLIIVAGAVGLVIARSGSLTGSPQAEGKVAAPMLNADAPQPEEAAQPAPEPQPADLAPAAPAEPTPAARTAQVPPRQPQPVRPDPQSADSVQMIQQAAALEDRGMRLDARRLLSRAYLQSEGNVRQAARAALDRINQELVFDPKCTDGATVHVVQEGEILGTIGPHYGVSWQCIARTSGIEDPKRVRVGQKLKVLTGTRVILVDKSEFILALFIDGQFIRQYLVGHGKDDCTPVGSFVVDEMLVDPTWYPPGGGIIKHGEKGHLIGDRWLGLKDKPGATGLGIHGTNDGPSIGTMCSNGCVRMHNADVIELYDFVSPGTVVQIVD